MTELYSTFDSLKSKGRNAADPYTYTTISYKEKSKFEQEGWVIHRKNSKSLRMKIEKERSVYFQDQVWNLFLQYQPEFINGNQAIELRHHKRDERIIEVDVDYIEDEVRIVSKVFSGEDSVSKLKLFVDEIAEKKPTLSRSLSKFDDKKRKVGIVVWTDDIKLNKSLQEKLEGYGIIRLNSTELEYFQSLQKQLGVVSKYQFFAKLFAGQTIPELDNKVPAIKGLMGGHTYYSFSIEPETLLKLSYVLHRVNTSEDNIGAYQRMIKKKRVSEITEFLDNGGFFPNSIIINIDTKNRKPLKWDNASSSDYTSRASLGVLHLPKKYRSAFVIDGQHRLYGYGGSQFRFTNTIPVVAFENLPSELQSKLFVEINHKQKSVPRNVLLALDSELKWNSPDADNAVSA
ncbi:MAG TPA: DGQHR domain-containing protein, partial [Bacteroidales bacterium]|nr:DGQHR domain-containing protein [Bacteroidales bacterium]